MFRHFHACWAFHTAQNVQDLMMLWIFGGMRPLRSGAISAKLRRTLQAYYAARRRRCLLPDLLEGLPEPSGLPEPTLSQEVIGPKSVAADGEWPPPAAERGLALRHRGRRSGHAGHPEASRGILGIPLWFAPP